MLSRVRSVESERGVGHSEGKRASASFQVGGRLRRQVDGTFGLITFATVDLWWINVFIFSLYAKTA